MTKMKVVFRGVVRAIEYTVHICEYDGTCTGIDWSFVGENEIRPESMTATEEGYIESCIFSNQERLALDA